MKEILLQLAAYNIWANGLLTNIISALPEEKVTQKLPGSFGSLFNTVIHLWDAEFIWWQRMKLAERITRPGDNYTGDIKELTQNLLQQNKQWYNWIEAAQEHALQHEFIYKNTKREQFKQPVYQMLVHVFNHGTYHRGQLVTMLRELGMEKIPATDFIEWSRVNSKILARP